MSLIVNAADYLASQTSLVVDTDLFIGEEATDSPDKCATLVGSAGADSESGLEMRPLQIIAKDTGYVSAEELAYELYELLCNKPGFPDTIEDVLYCESLNSPFPVLRDERGRWVFSANVIFKRRETVES